MQDLHNINPTQETCPTVDYARYTAPTLQHGLDHIVQIRDLYALKDLDQDLDMDYLDHDLADV